MLKSPEPGPSAGARKTPSQPRGFGVHPLRVAIVVATTVLTAQGCAEPAPPPTPGAAAAARTLGFIREWVQGSYNNLAQADADMQAELPPEQVHRPMHQLFVPVTMPQLDGYIVYQQSSTDGSTNPARIFRHGLMQYLPDPETGDVVQRELYFRNPEPYKNAHMNPEVLAEVRLEDLTWNAGCDFRLRTNARGTLVSGRIKERACAVFNEGLQKNMYADDAVEITATEYAFHGRFVDDAGNVLWGTASAELNRLNRQPSD